MSTELDEAWAAGLFEGEGCVRISTTRRGDKSWTYATLHLGMNDEDVVRRFHEVMGVGTVRREHRMRSGSERAFWRWNATSRADFEVSIAKLTPWLGQRRRAKLEEVRASTTVVPRRRLRATYCPRGHALEGDNVILPKDGRPRCRTCKNKSWREGYARRQNQK